MSTFREAVGEENLRIATGNEAKGPVAVEVREGIAHAAGLLDVTTPSADLDDTLPITPKQLAEAFEGAQKPLVDWSDPADPGTNGIPLYGTRPASHYDDDPRPYSSSAADGEEHYRDLLSGSALKGEE